jgi:hypothetical protein
LPVLRQQSSIDAAAASLRRVKLVGGEAEVLRNLHLLGREGATAESVMHGDMKSFGVENKSYSRAQQLIQ